MYALYIALASLFATAVLSQSLPPGIPSCAADCVNGFGGCQEYNVECICSNQPYIANLACCVSKACDKADQDATLQFANALCAGRHVTNLPQTATCASTASDSSSTGTTTGATSSSGSTTGTTTGTANAASTSASAAASPGAGIMNRMDGVGYGMIAAGIVAAL